MKLSKEKYSQVFAFPSQDEVAQIYDLTPILKELYIKRLELCTIYFNEIEEYEANYNLHAWHSRLNNKLGQLVFSFTQTNYHFSKGIPDKNWYSESVNGRKFFPDFTSEDYNRKFLFNFFSESFHYHFSSTLDILAHYLCLHLNIAVKGKLYFNENLFEKVREKNQSLYEVLIAFYIENKSNSKVRNDLAHNYPITEIDFRSKKKIENSRKVLTFGSYEYTDSQSIISNMEDALNNLVIVLREVEENLKP